MFNDSTVLLPESTPTVDVAEGGQNRDWGMRERVVAAFRSLGGTRTPGAAQTDAAAFYGVSGDAVGGPSGLPTPSAADDGARRRVMAAFRSAGVERAPAAAQAEAKAFFNV